MSAHRLKARPYYHWDADDTIQHRPAVRRTWHPNKHYNSMTLAKNILKKGDIQQAVNQWKLDNLMNYLKSH